MIKIQILQEEEKERTENRAPARPGKIAVKFKKDPRKRKRDLAKDENAGATSKTVKLPAFENSTEEEKFVAEFCENIKPQIKESKCAKVAFYLHLL